MSNVTKQEVIDRLRPVFERAVAEKTGVSFFLSDEEALVFTQEDRERLEQETGFPAPAPVFVRRFVDSLS